VWSFDRRNILIQLNRLQFRLIMLTCYVGVLRPDSEDGTRVGIKPFRHLQREYNIKILSTKRSV